MFRQFNNQDLPSLLTRLTCVFWIIAKVQSYNLWHTDRLFPLFPPFDFLENVPNEIHLTLFGLALTGMFGIVLFPKNKYMLGIALILEFSSCMLDQNRWQPYSYQYFLTVAFALFFRNNPRQFLNYFSFLLIVIYFNSGIHKFGEAFLHRIWEGMILHRFFGIPRNSISTIVHYSGLLLGLAEVVAAIGLLFFKNKKFFAMLMIGMHLFILWFISPLGLNYNSVVWPWNAIMIVFLYLVYIKNDSSAIIFPALVKGYNKILFLLLGILPLLNFFGWYDSFLSFSLYSGGLHKMEICIEDGKQLQKYAPYFSNGMFCKDSKTLNVYTWSLGEMNIIVYPEERIFKALVSKFKKENPNAAVTFYIYKYPYKAENIQVYR